MRPAWWREFLQKVKMFFYGFKGFSNYRFTDREIETLLLRGYRKTRAMRGAKGEGGDARFAALRREGAPNTAEESGQMRDSRVPHEEGFMEKYKFSWKGLYADYEFLYGRHPEYFEDAEHVRAAVEFVLAKPEEAGNIRDNLAFVREDQSTGKVYRVEINPKIIGKRCQIRSVHEITQTQYKKIKDRTARGDSASPDSVRQEQEFKTSEHPNMKTSDPSEKATVVDFLRYDSTESGKVKHSPEGGDMRFSIDGETKIFSLSELLQRFKDELSGTELNAEQQGIYDVVTGESKKTVIRKEDLETLEEFVLLKGGRGKGAKKIIQVHYAGVRGPVTALEIVNIGDVIRRGTYIPGDEAHPTSRSYELTTDDGARLRVVVDYDKQKNKSVINFYSNRKNGNRAHEASSGSITDLRITIAPESGKVKHSPEGGVRFSIDEEGKPLFNVQGYGEQKLESILQDKSISAKTQILTDDGSPDWGRVTPEMIANAPADLNLKALPIRLFKGDYGYGLVHLSKHLKDFTGRDLSNVILNVFGKPNKIYARRDGDAIKLEVFPKPPSQWGILELREEQGCYSVVTFYPRDNAHSKPKGEMIWRFGSQTETSQAASDQSRNGATGETPQVTQEETTVQTSHNINPFDIKVKYALEDGSDFSDGADKYTLENAKASKEGYRVERVNENAGRELTEAQGVAAPPEQIYKHGEVPAEQPQKWIRIRCMEYAKTHNVIGDHDAPVLGNGVHVTVGGVKAVLNHPGSDIKNNLIAAIPKMLKNAVLIQTERLDAKNSLNQTHLLASKVRYGDKRFIVGMIIHENQGKFYYDHELMEIENADFQNGRPGTTGAQVESASVLNVIRKALLSSGFDTGSEKNLRFSIEQYSDADWSDMVTYMRSKVGDVLNHPDSDYRRILEEAGMRCYSDADAHACAAEAMQQNERELRERGKQRRDNWIYENELLYRLVVDFAGSDKFTLVPDSFTGEKFTGTWIAEEYRKYSEKRAQKPTESDKQYKRYLQTREKALARAKGYRLDEVAEAIARKTGRDTLEVQEELVDYQNLKEGTSWGREGAARRLAAMTLDCIERGVGV